MPNKRTLVIGTTADYVEMIERRFPGRAVFLTDAGERARAGEPAPASEVLADLSRPDEAVAALRDHLRRFNLSASGVTCFDCESLSLAADVAERLSLPYASHEAVAACRSKLLSKELWRRAGLPCPAAELVQTETEAAEFLRRTGRPALLKPLTGCGSELLFVCETQEDCTRAFHVMRARLEHHPDCRMYANYFHGGAELNPRRTFVIEQLVRGVEYSCDFVVDGDGVEVIRLARKIAAAGQPVGTTLAYVLPAALPEPLEPEGFRQQLLGAARAVGLERAICMLDFMVEDGFLAKMIEIAPRPGGDCLPWLVRQSCGLDMLGAALDFAEGRKVVVPEPARWRQLVGLRLFAERAGVIRRIGDEELKRDPRVLETYLKRSAGHRVVLPPENYDSRVLGHVIFRPADGKDVSHIEAECHELRTKLELEMQ